MKKTISILHVRMSREVKDRAMTALASSGLTATEAVHLLFYRVIADQAFPLELRVAATKTGHDD